MANICRAHKLTPERVQAIAQGVALGMALSAAAGLADVSERTACRWEVRGKEALALRDAGKEIPEAEQPYADFVNALTRAKSKREGVLLSRLQQASVEGDARTTQWLLAVTNPDRYSRAGQAQVTQVVNNAVAVSTGRVESMSDQQIETRLTELRQLQEGDNEEE